MFDLSGIDDLYKEDVCGLFPEFEKFILRLNEITEKNNVHCVMTASLPAEQVPASLAVFVRDTH